MGEEVEQQEFTRADRTRHREKVRRNLDVFARMLREAAFDTDDPMTGLEVELNLVDEAGELGGGVIDTGDDFDRSTGGVLYLRARSRCDDDVAVQHIHVGLADANEEAVQRCALPLRWSGGQQQTTLRWETVDGGTGDRRAEGDGCLRDEWCVDVLDDSGVGPGNGRVGLHDGQERRQDRQDRAEDAGDDGDESRSAHFGAQIHIGTLRRSSEGHGGVLCHGVGHGCRCYASVIRRAHTPGPGRLPGTGV